jgi:hypothetical protein
MRLKYIAVKKQTKMQYTTHHHVQQAVWHHIPVDHYMNHGFEIIFVLEFWQICRVNASV